MMGGAYGPSGGLRDWRLPYRALWRHAQMTPKPLVSLVFGADYGNLMLIRCRVA